MKSPLMLYWKKRDGIFSKTFFAIFNLTLWPRVETQIWARKSNSIFWAYLIDVELIPNIYMKLSESGQKWPQGPKKCSKWPKSGFTARDPLNFFQQFYWNDITLSYYDFLMLIPNMYMRLSENGQNCPKNDLEI